MFKIKPHKLKVYVPQFLVFRSFWGGNNMRAGKFLLVGYYRLILGFIL